MENAKRILVCEDEDAIREFVVINLKRAGYEVVDVASGEAALETYKQENGGFGMALLDIMLPGIDGLSVCKQLRESDKQIGIIMLSAKSQEMDKVGGLMQGADDYVTKPFSPMELVARVDAVFRRVGMGGADSAASSELVSGPFVLNIKSRTLHKDSVRIDLTQVEFQLLEYLMRNPNVALDRSTLLATVWGDSYCGDDKIVDVNVRRLRMKIEDVPSDPHYLTTVWGFGYKWRED